LIETIPPQKKSQLYRRVSIVRTSFVIKEYITKSLDYHTVWNNLYYLSYLLHPRWWWLCV